MLMMQKLLFGTFVGAAIVLMLTPLAHAITITDATLSSGTVTVSGNKAVKLAAISWEGTPVTTSTKGGAFTFTTANVPEDCVGELSDGVSTVSVAIAGCTVPPPPPTTAFPATGQTTCWDSAGTVIACSGTGQDGDIKAGAVLSYTSNGDGTITDNNTGLVWEKKTTTCLGNIHCVDDDYDWNTALTVFIAALNTAPCFAGHCDWRLPNIKELQSIVNYQTSPTRAVSPAFNDDAGSGCSASCTAGSWYWSSSSYANVPDRAWVIDFANGGVSLAFKSSNSLVFVRAVRGGL